MRIHLHFSRCSAWAVLLTVFLGCALSSQLMFNPNFSVNLAEPGKKWPKDKTLTPAQSEVLAKYGPPDYFHIWWTRQGDIQTYLKVDRKFPRILDYDHSWIYLQRNEDIVFKGNSHYGALPISDQLRTVCEYGDPDDIKKNVNRDGVLVETWQYYSYGVMLKFCDGTLSERQEFPPMGTYIKK
jgi:hypothetical protein